MTSETLEDYIERMKASYTKSGKGSMEFMLEQIRALADTKGAQHRSPIKPDEAQKIAKDDKKVLSDRNEARASVMKYQVLETTSQPSMAMIGKMLFYKYDPKGKATIPYYDQFPLVFPFRIGPTYMIGMNMHYLPPVERARLMMNLTTVVNSTTIDSNTKLLITYKLLNSSSKFQYFKPCIKKYLFGQLRSRVMTINPAQWNQVLLMPLANFQKASEFKVWNDSLNKVKNQVFK